MKVKLKRAIRENVQFNSLGKCTDPGKLKVSIRRGRATPFLKGAIVEMSDSSAAKYIEAGAAEAYNGPKEQESFSQDELEKILEKQNVEAPAET